MMSLFASLMILLFNPLTLIAVFGWAVWMLRGTAALPGPLSEGQRRGRVLALAALVVLVAGFGLCGGAGTVMGLAGLRETSSEARAYSTLFLVPGLLGLAVALLCLWLMRRYRRRAAAQQDAP
ncbi:MAG TPA: hypothetical protein VLA61_08355 [Ideonella sp.]|uniref:hypothetical protein n=1 Tax=Ideonella sp. TaxID=1929293 RepID=UPI002C17CE1A|nr:hypothetical protein [Ideonella sp.]HSI48265.1 hypothetical protein [Ideonella sp.]